MLHVYSTDRMLRKMRSEASRRPHKWLKVSKTPDAAEAVSRMADVSSRKVDVPFSLGRRRAAHATTLDLLTPSRAIPRSARLRSTPTHRATRCRAMTDALDPERQRSKVWRGGC